MNQFGAKVRQAREASGLLLRELAALLEVDPAILSKVERGERPAKRELIPLLARHLKLKEKELLTLWLAGRVYEMIKEEEVAAAALQVAEKAMQYHRKSKKPDQP